MDDKQRELYDAILITIRTALQKHGSSHVMTNNSVIVLNGLLRLRQICCHPQLLPFELNFNHAHSSGKFDQFCDLVARLISERRKIVVFCQFTSMLKIILRWVIAQHIPHWYLDGTTENRGSIVEGFECADIGIFLISLKAGGTGINLVSAHDVIVYDPWWNPAVENQAIDRLHRIGQTETVSVYKMITIDSIEEKIVKLQNEKKDIFDAVLQHQETPQSFEVLKKLLLQ
jgi:SNF2 family DNA or RNA helicase